MVRRRRLLIVVTIVAVEAGEEMLKTQRKAKYDRHGGVGIQGSYCVVHRSFDN